MIIMVLIIIIIIIIERKIDANNANSPNNDRSIILFELLYLSKIELMVITKKTPLKNKL